MFPTKPIWGGLVFELSGKGRFDPEAAKDGTPVDDFVWGYSTRKRIEKSFMTIDYLWDFSGILVSIFLGIAIQY